MPRMESTGKHTYDDAQHAPDAGTHTFVADVENGGSSELWASFARSMADENKRARY
jgi:hypothetical protein